MGNKIEELVQFTYPDFKTKFQQPEYLKERAILATTNDIVDEINDHMLKLVPNIEREYFSADTISKCSDACNDADILYPVEYLNTLTANNFPAHKLKLKVGVPIMLLRNLNHTIGLCNGTRLIVTNLGDNVIEATIITGTHRTNYIYTKNKSNNMRMSVAIYLMSSTISNKSLLLNDYKQKSRPDSIKCRSLS